MSTIQLSRQAVQRAVCSVLAVFIVSSGLTLGYLGTLLAERNAVQAVAALRV